MGGGGGGDARLWETDRGEEEEGAVAHPSIAVEVFLLSLSLSTLGFSAGGIHSEGGVCVLRLNVVVGGCLEE